MQFEGDLANLALILSPSQKHDRTRDFCKPPLALSIFHDKFVTKGKNQIQHTKPIEDQL